MAIAWKLPMLEDYTIDYPTSIMDEPFAFEETGHFAAKHYRDQFAVHLMDLISAFHMDLDLLTCRKWIMDWIWIMISIHPVPLAVMEVDARTESDDKPQELEHFLRLCKSMRTRHK